MIYWQRLLGSPAINHKSLILEPLRVWQPLDGLFSSRFNEDLLPINYFLMEIKLMQAEWFDIRRRLLGFNFFTMDLRGLKVV